jgi:hypothetical protein
MNRRQLARLFKTVFDSNDCEMNQDKNGVVTVAYTIGAHIEHLMSLDANPPVLHAIRTDKDPHWIPKLREFDRLSEYLRLVRRLCKDTTRPTSLQIKRVIRCAKMSSVLFAVYGDTFTSFLTDAHTQIRTSARP